MDSIIDAKEFQIERKRFHVEFRENDRGKFLRITEEAHGRRNTIIVPSTGVGDFTAAIVVRRERVARVDTLGDGFSLASRSRRVRHFLTLPWPRKKRIPEKFQNQRRKLSPGNPGALDTFIISATARRTAMAA